MTVYVVIDYWQQKIYLTTTDKQKAQAMWAEVNHEGGDAEIETHGVVE